VLIPGFIKTFAHKEKTGEVFWWVLDQRRLALMLIHVGEMLSGRG